MPAYTVVPPTNQLRIVYFGDSHVKYLRQYTHNFIPVRTQLQYWHGVGGMTAGLPGSGAVSREEQLRSALSRAPDVVVLSLGGNDITPDCHAKDIVASILALADRFEKGGARRVYVTGIIPRITCRGMKSEEFRRVQLRIHQLLKIKLSDRYLPLPNMGARSVLIRDGVHLNDRGNRKFVWCIRRGLIEYPGLRFITDE